MGARAERGPARTASEPAREGRDDGAYDREGCGRRRGLRLIQATALLIVIVYVVASLVADALYAVLNPRIHYG